MRHPPQVSVKTWGLGWVGLAASCRSRPSGVGFLPCPTTRLNYLTVRFLCVGARAGRGVGGGWALRVGGKCGLVLQARWGGHGSLTLSPPGSSGPGHRILLVTETRCPPVPRLRTHGDGCAPGTTGGGPALLDCL